MAPIDPCSVADSTQPLATKISLTLLMDFEQSIIRGACLLSFPSPHTGPLSLDMHYLRIHQVLDAQTQEPLMYSYPSTPHAVKGSDLTVMLFGQSSILVLYSTLSTSPALLWVPPLNDQGTPFLYTQCQPIQARSVFPCQDTPAARVSFQVSLNLPRSMDAVMTAEMEDTYYPTTTINDERGRIFATTWFGVVDSKIGKLWRRDRRVCNFKIEHPIPPSLFAFAAGRMHYVRVGPKTRIFSDAQLMPILDKAQEQLKEVQRMIRQGEELFGAYEWPLCDLYILHPNYAYDGMETPMTAFLSSTMINGDVTGFDVVMRGRARAWTGHLVTHRTNEHLWLSEGFTTYAERRLMEVLQGKEKADLNIWIGWSRLQEEMERFRDNMEFTKLKTNTMEVNPHDVFSQVPSEKGFQFLYRIEHQVGRAEFDKFFRAYSVNFKFRSIDTEMFLEFLSSYFPDIGNQIDLRLWTEGTGIPDQEVSEPVSTLYEKIMSLVSGLLRGNIPKKDQVKDWQWQEWKLFLEKVPRTVGVFELRALNMLHNLSRSQDNRVKEAFLELANKSG